MCGVREGSSGGGGVRQGVVGGQTDGGGARVSARHPVKVSTNVTNFLKTHS